MSRQLRSLRSHAQFKCAEGLRGAGTGKPLYVTEPYLPPLSDFIPYLEKIWESRWLTNAGQFHKNFEEALQSYLGVKHLSLFANGTLALMTALRSLGIDGEVITTPFSFVATSHALLWNNLEPVFADVDPETFNLDPKCIEAAITPRTRAILPVHCFGRPCDTEAIQRIADHYGLKVIYDAAHAFGVRKAGHSVLCHGDLSILSFHATKVFTTFEGGAVVCPDAEFKQRIDYLKNFGFADEVTVMATGINGKMSEFQAALGLLQIEHVGAVLEMRRRIDGRYREALANCPGLSPMAIPADTDLNWGYFPILVGPGYALTRDELYHRLLQNKIHARRYFSPLISNMPMYRHLPSAEPGKLPVAHRIADSVLCLPIFPHLSEAQQQKVIDVLHEPS